MTWDEDDTAQRPLWLITFADLALLLVGFFVLLQANQRLDPQALAAGIRAGFGFETAPPAMPVEMAVVDSFATGSALPLSSGDVLAWARSAARDPRTRLTITGEVDGTSVDVDRVTGSGPILASDRARAIAALLVKSGAVAPGRIAIATAKGRRRAVLTLGFAGDRQ